MLLTYTSILFDYGFSFRSTNIHNFENINFDDISLSSQTFIIAKSSNLHNLKNHSISHTNSVIYTLVNVNLYHSETLSILNSVSAFDILKSNITITASKFEMLNSTGSSALYSKSSNISISNSTFDSNIATQGAALTFL